MTNRVAFESGKSDGADRVQEDRRSSGKTPNVSEWFGIGGETADTALINALSGVDLARALGITVEQLEERGTDFDAACADYNAG